MNQDQQSRPAAIVVARRFVKQYYTILSEDPISLHKFYTDESVLSHGVEEQEEDLDIFCGQKSIHQKILSMDYKKSKVNVSFIDCQSSLNGGVVVSVVGQLYNESQKPVTRRFLQVFFLAIQPMSGGISNNYFVLNDIFRYLKEPTVPVTNPTPVVLENTHSHAVDPKSHVHDKQSQNQIYEKRNETTSVPLVHANNVASTNNVGSIPPTPGPSSIPPSQSQPQHTAPIKKQSIAVIQAMETKDEESIPKTWAYLVGGPAYVEHIRSKVDTKTQRQTNDEDESTTSDFKLYVNNIPYSSTKQALEFEFRKYGNVKFINWKNNYGYAFVEYENEDGINAVMKHIEKEPIKFEGRPLRIERKRSGKGYQNGRGRQNGWKRNDRKSQSFGGQSSQQHYQGGQSSQQHYQGGQSSQQHYQGGQSSQQHYQHNNNFHNTNTTNNTQQANNFKENTGQNKQRGKGSFPRQNKNPSNKRTFSSVN